MVTVDAEAWHGMRVDRPAPTYVVEVCPAASLRSCQLSHRGYKGRAHISAPHWLVEALQRAALWLDRNEHDRAFPTMTTRSRRSSPR